jgi:hypothetical protein
MTTAIKDFIDFWVANSVHAKLELGQIGSSQSADELASRLLGDAEQQGLSPDEINREIGDPVKYIRDKLVEFNLAESERRSFKPK